MTSDSPQAIQFLNTIRAVIGQEPITSVFGTPVEDLDGPIPRFFYSFDFVRLGLIPSTRSSETLDEIYDRFVETELSGATGFVGGIDMDFVLGSQLGETIATGDDGLNIVDGGGGADLITGGDAIDILGGGDGNDRLRGEGGDDQLFGNAGNDRIWGGAGNDALDGGTGNDQLRGEAGNDRLNGGDGDDLLLGQGGNDTLFGDAGDDLLRGGGGRDELTGGLGNDTLMGDNGNDSLFGGGGDNVLLGGNGNDVIRANFQLSTNLTGTSTMDGGAGRDSIQAMSLDGDIVIGGTGNDILGGGFGDDVFIFRGGDGRDELQNFGVGQSTTTLPPSTGGAGSSNSFGFDRLIIDKEGFDSFDDIAGLIQQRGDGAVLDFGDGDRIDFTNFSITGGMIINLDGLSIAPNLTELNILFGSADDFLL